MDNRISVLLTGPAKIEGKWRKPGDDEAVRAMAKTLADAAVQAAIEGATAELIAERDAAQASAAAAEEEVARQRGLIIGLEAELTAAKANTIPEGEATSSEGQQAALEEQPPADAPKNTRNKGAGAKQG